METLNIIFAVVIIEVLWLIITNEEEDELRRRMRDYWYSRGWNDCAGYISDMTNADIVRH